MIDVGAGFAEATPAEATGFEAEVGRVPTFRTAAAGFVAIGRCGTDGVEEIVGEATIGTTDAGGMVETKRLEDSTAFPRVGGTVTAGTKLALGG